MRKQRVRLCVRGWSWRCMYPRECRGWERSPPRGSGMGVPPGCTPCPQEWPASQGRSADPAGGAPLGLLATGAAGSSPGRPSRSHAAQGGVWWGSPRGATQLTVAGDVIVPGKRVAGGPRGAAELQEKCQVVEGAQRHGERGPHGARSGRRGRRRLTSGPVKTADLAPSGPRPVRPGCPAAAAAPSPAEPVGPRVPAPARLRPAPAAGSERTPSRPPPTAGLFPSAEGHPLSAPLPPHPPPALPPPAQRRRRRRRRDLPLDLSSKFCPGSDF